MKSVEKCEIRNKVTDKGEVFRKTMSMEDLLDDKTPKRTNMIFSKEQRTRVSQRMKEH